MTRIELLAHLLAGSANGRPDDVRMDDYAEGVVKQANRIADLVLAEEPRAEPVRAAKIRPGDDGTFPPRR